MQSGVLPPRGRDAPPGGAKGACFPCVNIEFCLFDGPLERTRRKNGPFVPSVSRDRQQGRSLAEVLQPEANGS